MSFSVLVLITDRQSFFSEFDFPLIENKVVSTVKNWTNQNKTEV